MVRSEGLLFSLVFLVTHLTGSEHQTNGANHQLADGFQSFFKTRYKSWLQVLDGTNLKKYTTGGNELTTVDAVTAQKKINNLVLTSPNIEGSIGPIKALRVPYFLRFGKNAQEDRQANSLTCTCEPTPTCSTTCTSLEIRCGRTCTHSTIFTAECGCHGGRHQATSTSSSVSSNGCATLNAGCLATVGAVGAVGAVVAAAAAVAVAVAVAVPVGLQLSGVGPSETERFDPQVLDIGDIFGQRTPVNNLTFPVNGNDFPADGCGDNSVRFSDGNCYPVLTRGPCADPHRWVTLDPATIQARCSPRLCGRQRVFVGQDGLCHDINDPSGCSGGRRLYYTAYGDPLCDCPIGQYPFPDIQDDCVPLFSKGPCPDGNVVSITPEGRLGCTPEECQSIDGQDNSLQLVSTGSGVCYPLGSRGPCTNTSQLLGYDVFRRRLQCVNILDPSSPYFSSPEEEDLIDSVYNQFVAEYDDYQISLIYQNAVERKDKGQRRQGGNTAGALQFPSSSPDALLQPCRNGAREGINFKCTNPLVSNSNARPVQPAVSSAFKCPGNGNLQATGQCASDNRAASCGPSFQFNSNTGQCRSVFRR
ncbi:uncharacterized protein LOC130691269 [Daphnia carinata]|uniref:uncharacterized protein LOC130691269 n=1 Tax=Daphnia carinata TaxID=120202 RepID=UPI00257A0FF5|nr:uncharacterized protein LOC130691269 [Daphnia carinata]XP_059350507.1 uncharacterized protein LOC130691269 [Daphnia carinata]